MIWSHPRFLDYDVPGFLPARLYTDHTDCAMMVICVKLEDEHPQYGHPNGCGWWISTEPSSNCYGMVHVSFYLFFFKSPNRASSETMGCWPGTHPKSRLETSPPKRHVVWMSSSGAWALNPTSDGSDHWSQEFGTISWIIPVLFCLSMIFALEKPSKNDCHWYLPAFNHVSFCQAQHFHAQMRLLLLWCHSQWMTCNRKKWNDIGGFLSGNLKVPLGCIAVQFRQVWVMFFLTLQQRIPENLPDDVKIHSDISDYVLSNKLWKCWENPKQSLESRIYTIFVFKSSKYIVTW